MDANANLQDQLTLANLIQGCDEEDEISRRCEECAENGAKLAELVLALSEWIEKGGFLPAKWTKPEELRCEKCGTVYLSEPGRTGIRLCNNKKCERPVDANPNRQGLNS